MLGYKSLIVAIAFILLPGSMCAQPSFSRETFLNQRSLRAFAVEMHNAGLVHTDQFDSLLVAIEDGKITADVDVLRYFDRGVVIDCRELPDDPAEYYRIVYEKVRSIVPGFTFSDLRLEPRLKYDFGDYQSWELVITMAIDGRDYSQAVFFAPDRKKSRDSYLGMIGHEFYQIINKWLADTRADYRLHFVQCSVPWGSTKAAMEDRLGLVALKRDQYKLFRHYDWSVLKPRSESFSEYMGPLGIERAIRAYQEIGLFDGLTEEQIREGMNESLRVRHQDINGILAQFPNVIVKVEGESADADHVYTGYTEELAAATHGVFAPTNIHDDYIFDAADSFTYSFEFAGKRYDTTLKNYGDWLDGSFISLIARSIEENVSDGRFYYLYGDGDMIFLTERQYQYLMKEQLLRFVPQADNEWKMELDE